MNEMNLFHIYEIDGGPLSDLTFEGRTWRFDFEMPLCVESLGGWRLFEPARDVRERTLLGSRDIEDADDPLNKALVYLRDFELRILNFYEMREMLELVMMPPSLGRTISIQLLSNSAIHENWRIIGEDFLDSDHNHTIVDRLKRNESP